MTVLAGGVYADTHMLVETWVDVGYLLFGQELSEPHHTRRRRWKGRKLAVMQRQCKLSAGKDLVEERPRPQLQQL